MLGWIAVSQIRRPAGKLYGMWLAVFDGLLFPLLLLGALVIGLPILAWKLGYDPEHGFAGAKVLLLLTIGLSIAAAVWLDSAILRRVWRAVNKESLGVQPQGPIEPDAASQTETPDIEDAKMAGRPWFWLAASIGLHGLGLLGLLAFFAFVVPPTAIVLVNNLAEFVRQGGYLLVPVLLALDAVICWLLYRFTPRKFFAAWSATVLFGIFALLAVCGVMLYAPKRSAASYTASARAGANLTFGPVTERVITVGNDARSFYSFVRGDYVSGPTDFDPTDHDRNQDDLWKWLTRNEVDVYASQRNGKPVLMRCEMVTTDLNEDEFDTLTPAQLAIESHLAGSDESAVPIPGVEHSESRRTSRRQGHVRVRKPIRSHWPCSGGGCDQRPARRGDTLQADQHDQLPARREDWLQDRARWESERNNHVRTNRRGRKPRLRPVWAKVRSWWSLWARSHLVGRSGKRLPPIR